MKKTWWLILIFVLAGLLAVGCSSDDDDGTDGDEDGDTPVEDGDEAQEDGDDGGGEPQSCSSEAVRNFGGMMKASCDTKVGVCETAVVDGEAWFPCVDDPDCCCDPEDSFAEDIYGCEFDSCVDDGFCDPLCNAGVDPDC